MNSVQPIIKDPNLKLVKEYLNQFSTDKRYSSGDSAILKLFDAFPNNKELDHIYLKVSIINDMYSTNLYGTFRMAEHILSLDIDERLKQGDPSLVHSIATGHNIKIRNEKKGKDYNFYSFATKYCNWHNQNDYAIYDSFVGKILIAYRNKNSELNFKNDDLKDFEKFKNIIHDFARVYNLENVGFKKLDKFLWMYAKDLYN